jgi:hypothetical protein
MDENVKELCRQASVEYDSAKLARLVGEIIEGMDRENELIRPGLQGDSSTDPSRLRGRPSFS